MLDIVLFAVFPYVAVILAVVMGLYRYFTNRFSLSSLSSQFLENRCLFWGSVPWHYAILLVLLAHLLVGLFGGLWLWVVGTPGRLYLLEVVGLSLGLTTVVTATLFIARRLVQARLRQVTSVMDWVLLGDLLLQVALGAYVALVYRWGSVWYLDTAVPWLSSLVRLDPQVQYISVLPWVAKLHFFNAFVLVGLIPFTRLIHMVTLPVSYLWRPRQVVIWNRAVSRRRA